MTPEMFPPTAEELMLQVRANLVADVERRERALENAENKLEDARHVLYTFDRAREAQARAGGAVLNTATGEIVEPAGETVEV